MRSKVLAGGPVLLFIAAVHACGGSPTEPDAPAAAGAALTIPGEHVLTLTRGESAVLTVQERDAQGRPVESSAGSYSWATSDPAVLRVSSAGVLTTGTELGYALVTVRTPRGLTATRHVWVQPPEADPSTFTYTLVFGEDVPQRWRDALMAGAARWEQVIRAPLPEASVQHAQACAGDPDEPLPPLTGTERGVRVYIQMSSSFTPGTYAEAVGGPCLQRLHPRPTTVYGRIALNRDHPVEGIGSPRLRYVATHELGHVLGLVALVQGIQPPWYDPRTNVYTGVMGLEGYRRESGSLPAQLTLGGGAHWGFPWDIMGAPVHRISAASVGGLMDLGYPAAWYGAH